MSLNRRPGAATPERAVLALERHRKPFSFRAYSSGPAGTTLDPNALVTTDARHWSYAGEPTIYVGRDRGVALAELGRHWSDDTAQAPASLWSLAVLLTAGIDLTDPETKSDLGLPDDPTWILDRDRCRSLGAWIRGRGQHDGMIVPSVAFLDDPTRWTAVVFAGALSRPVELAIAVRGRTHSLIVER